MSRPRIGVVLSGCGVYDGAEIHEAVITLLALDRAGAEAVCVAPDAEQLHVVNHLTGKVADGERRNVLVESARIARGRISDIAAVQASDLDAIVLPGGFGAAKNLCDFALTGPQCVVHPEVARLLRAVHSAGKPIAAMCIAPAILAKLLGDEAPDLTIGSDPATAAALGKLGARHRDCAASDIVTDGTHRLVTTPAYMLATSIAEAATGIERLVGELMTLVREHPPVACQ
jgi:enhancing lycopene biosynthesis protein 2